MWSFTQKRMISTLEELVEDPEKPKQRRKWLGIKFLYYSCCFLRDPYKSHETDQLINNIHER